MNFKTQVCTTLEQSERLLALGLKKETADAFYDLDDHYGPTAYILYANLSNGWDDDYVPAWSLHRLMAMMDSPVEISSTYLEISGAYRVAENGNVYDSMIDEMEELIQNGLFNREYLEEPK